MRPIVAPIIVLQLLLVIIIKAGGAAAQDTNLVVSKDWSVNTAGHHFFDSNYASPMVCNQCMPTEDHGHMLLTCDTSLSDWGSTSFGTIYFGCDSGCSSCSFSEKFGVGAVFPSTVDPYFGNASLTAASVTCCPELVKISAYSDTNCNEETSFSYVPTSCQSGTAGISLINAAGRLPDTSYTHFGDCTTDGADISAIHSHCTGAEVLSGARQDSCPTAHSCALNYGISTGSSFGGNCAVVSISGFSRPVGKNTYKCSIDSSRVCLMVGNTTRIQAEPIANLTQRSTLNCTAIPPASPPILLDGSSSASHLKFMLCMILTALFVLI